MRKKFFLILLAMVFAKFILFISNFNMLHSHASNLDIRLGEWSEERIDGLLEYSGDLNSTGDKIDYISGKFLGTSYEADTLNGSYNQKETLTVNLEGMDCLTYLDYVEALSVSDNFHNFLSNLKTVRYKAGKVEYKERRHFFSDWKGNPDIIDVTLNIGGDKAVTVLKKLNKKSKDSLYLQGIPLVDRNITYIPSEKLDNDIIASLKTGDYIGIYSNNPGLDVSHTGILIKKENGVFLRHASSKMDNMKVVDEDFIKYIKHIPGIVVYRKMVS